HAPGRDGGGLGGHLRGVLRVRAVLAAGRILVWFVLPLQARTFVIVMTVLSLIGGMGGRFEPGVAHFAHLGGFAGGWLFFRWTTRQLRRAGFRPAPPAPRAPPTSALERWQRATRETMHPVNREEFDRLVAKGR